MGRFPMEERQEWGEWVTPKALAQKPIHRWYAFPHSFSSELVHALMDEWGVGPDDHILDPFVGAGTTVLSAKERGIPATGYDLSPLAVLASRVKVADYAIASLERVWRLARERFRGAVWDRLSKTYPELVTKALPGALLGTFDSVLRGIGQIEASTQERDFLKLALLAVVPAYSRAVATGGWLKWVAKEVHEASVLDTLDRRVRLMLEDLQASRVDAGPFWHVEQADARNLPDKGPTYSAVITSPPYPNRHDYTRVFGVELLLAFCGLEEARQLRYQSFHSHPEARPIRGDTTGFTMPAALGEVLLSLGPRGIDARIPAMLEGYFLDMYLCLRELKRVCRRGARIALVVGNVQYCGEPIMVDELTAEVGEEVGLVCEKIVPVRYRGNSAQQMARYGRRRSRESIVVFRDGV